MRRLFEPRIDRILTSRSLLRPRPYLDRILANVALKVQAKICGAGGRVWRTGAAGGRKVRDAIRPLEKRATSRTVQKMVPEMNFVLDPELKRIQQLARELAADFATRACGTIRKAPRSMKITPSSSRPASTAWSRQRNTAGWAPEYLAGLSRQRSSRRDALRRRSLSICTLRLWRPI